MESIEDKQFKKREKKPIESFFINCPHCNIGILIQRNHINCGVFRCGVYKNTGKPIRAHMKKEACENLIKDDKIFGCGKPFEFKGDQPVICDYK